MYDIKSNAAFDAKSVSIQQVKKFLIEMFYQQFHLLYSDMEIKCLTYTVKKSYSWYVVVQSLYVSISPASSTRYASLLKWWQQKWMRDVDALLE